MHDSVKWLIGARSLTAARKVSMGFEPAVPLEDGLHEEFAWALGATRARELARA